MALPLEPSQRYEGHAQGTSCPIKTSLKKYRLPKIIPNKDLKKKNI